MYKQKSNFYSSCTKINRTTIECFFENKPGGCRKPHCVFLHRKLGRSITADPNHEISGEESLKNLDFKVKTLEEIRRQRENKQGNGNCSNGPSLSLEENKAISGNVVPKFSKKLRIVRAPKEVYIKKLRIVRAPKEVYIKKLRIVRAPKEVYTKKLRIVRASKEVYTRVKHLKSGLQKASNDLHKLEVRNRKLKDGCPGLCSEKRKTEYSEQNRCTSPVQSDKDPENDDSLLSMELSKPTPVKVGVCNILSTTADRESIDLENGKEAKGTDRFMDSSVDVLDHFLREAGVNVDNLEDGADGDVMFEVDQYLAS